MSQVEGLLHIRPSGTFEVWLTHLRPSGWLVGSMMAAGVMDDLLSACRNILTEHLSKISNTTRILKSQNGHDEFGIHDQGKYTTLDSNPLPKMHLKSAMST